MENGLAFLCCKYDDIMKYILWVVLGLTYQTIGETFFCGFSLQYFCSHLVVHCVRHQGNEVSRLPSTMAENADKHK